MLFPPIPDFVSCLNLGPYSSTKADSVSTLWAFPKMRKVQSPKAFTAATRLKTDTHEPVISIRCPARYTQTTPTCRKKGNRLAILKKIHTISCLVFFAHGVKNQTKTKIPIDLITPVYLKDLLNPVSCFDLQNSHFYKPCRFHI